MRRFVFVSVVLLAVAVAPSNAQAATGGGCAAFCGTGGSVGTYDGGLFTGIGIWTKPLPIPGGGGGVSPTGPVIEYRYDPVCNDTCDSPISQGVFTAAGCVAGQTAMWVSTRTVNPPGDWVLQGPPECLTPGQQLPYDPAQLQATVDQYFQRIPLPLPKLRIAPADNAVVNLPEIVSADTPAQTTFTVDVAPFPTVTITASVSWQWDFGDGTTLTTTSPGRAYDINDPNATDYISHTYTRASDGYALSVTSVWTATYTIEGVTGQQTVDGNVRRTTTRTLTAADYGAVLTGN